MSEDGPMIRDARVAPYTPPGAARTPTNYEQVKFYRNFLDWLFATTKTSEWFFRQSLIAMVRPQAGEQVLVVGCGPGDELVAIANTGAEVYAVDKSHTMAAVAGALRGGRILSVEVADAQELPFAADTFHAVYSFGGINEFGDMRKAIAEMNRVARPGGRVVIGDEGIAPWAPKETRDMVVANNALWGKPCPIDQLPPDAREVQVKWVLAECFWVIRFYKGGGFDLNPHVVHQSPRGGTMASRYAEWKAELRCGHCDLRPDGTDASGHKAGVPWKECGTDGCPMKNPY